MPKLYSGTEVVKRLKRLGFVTISQKGSHLKLRSLGTRNIRTVIVPCTSKLPRDSQVNSPTSQNHQRSSRLGKVIVLKQRPTVSLVKGRSGYCREGLKPHPWQLACVCEDAVINSKNKNYVNTSKSNVEISHHHLWLEWDPPLRGSTILTTLGITPVSNSTPSFFRILFWECFVLQLASWISLHYRRGFVRQLNSHR